MLLAPVGARQRLQEARIFCAGQRTGTFRGGVARGAAVSPGWRGQSKGRSKKAIKARGQLPDSQYDPTSIQMSIERRRDLKPLDARVGPGAGAGGARRGKAWKRQCWGGAH
jgi:hypothetical protein